MDIKLLFNLMDFYHYIDFNSLSKFEIKEEPTTDDAKMIFSVSNAVHKLRKDKYEITEEDKNYYNKILKTNGTTKKTTT